MANATGREALVAEESIRAPGGEDLDDDSRDEVPEDEAEEEDLDGQPKAKSRRRKVDKEKHRARQVVLRSIKSRGVFWPGDG